MPLRLDVEKFESANSCPINRKKNRDGLIKAITEGRKTYDYYDSLPRHTKNSMTWNKGKYFADFSLNGRGNHKRVLIIERGHKCEKCHNTIWMNEKIPLDLEHIDGNHNNNVRENLLLLCLNCHGQTKTYKGKNINRDQVVTDEKLLIALKTESNIRKALISVGLTGKGKNYERAYKLIGQLKSEGIIPFQNKNSFGFVRKNNEIKIK